VFCCSDCFTPQRARPRSSAADRRPDRQDLRYRLARQVEAIRYTFNVDLSALKLKLARSWVWERKTDTVTYEGKDKAGNPVKVTYPALPAGKPERAGEKRGRSRFHQRSVLAPVPVPPRLGRRATITDEGMKKLPLGKGTAHKVVVKYAGGGYTAGRHLDAFRRQGHRIQELEFHHGGDAKPSLVIATWADYKKAGPLLFSLDHRGKADGKPFRLFFSNVAVKLSGSNDWVEAK